MSDSTDHYALLGIAPDADPETIRIAVAGQLRRWNVRASTSPTLESRQRAESMVARLNKAKRELLDPDLRPAHDARREGGSTRPDAPASTPPPRARQVVQARQQAPEREVAAGDWYDRAWENVQQERYEEALEDAARATGADPRHAPGWLLLGWLRMRTGDLAGARLGFDTAVALNPSSPRPHAELAELHRRTGALPAAAASYARAADLAAAKGRGSAAARADAEEYRRAEQQVKGDILRRTRGATLYDQGRFEQALDTYLALHRDVTDDPELVNQIGRCLSVLANGNKFYPGDGSLPYIASPAAAARVKELAERALAYELTDARLVRKLREDVHYAEMLLSRTRAGEGSG